MSRYVNIAFGDEDISFWHGYTLDNVLCGMCYLDGLAMGPTELTCSSGSSEMGTIAVHGFAFRCLVSLRTSDNGWVWAPASRAERALPPRFRTRLFFPLR
jgi:hypothetical protein